MRLFHITTITGFCSASALVVTTGCKKQLDINQNPNFPTIDQGTPSVVFAAGVLATMAKTGGDLEIIGGMWSQHITQAALSQQYTDVDSYNLPPTSIILNSSYAVLFTSGIKNFQYVIDKSKEEQDWNYYLMGNVMKAYSTEILVDLYDKIPFTGAVQGLANLNPAFDDGFAIYTSLIDSIDVALGKDFGANTNTLPGKQDMIFGGDMDQWRKFANTLELKMYLRMINAHPGDATTGVNKVMNNGIGFLSTEAGVQSGSFSDNPGLENPLYEQNIFALNTPVNLRASNTFVSWLIHNHDARAVPLFGSSNPVAINQGDFRSISSTYTSAAVLVETSTDPVEFLSIPESYFLQAEADLRYNGGANAKALYELGVRASFAEFGLADTAGAYLTPTGKYAYPALGTTAQKLEAIIVQKWAALSYGGHGIESFFEKNRTGYPRTSPVYSTDSAYVPGQFVVAKNSVLTPATALPKRLVYPYNETSRNINAPKTVVPMTTAVWWGL